MNILPDSFLFSAYEMAQRLRLNLVHLLFVMNHESGLNPSARNPAGAYGLIQIQNLKGVGWTGSPEEFLALSEQAQLPYVERYLQSYAHQNLDSMRRIHQALFLPATLAEGSDRDLILARRAGTRWGGKENAFYEGNRRAFDPEGKGYITVGDLEKADIRAALSPAGQKLRNSIERLREILPEALPKVNEFPWKLFFGLAGTGFVVAWWKRRKKSS
jgi:hypothetical protein